jgi:hypothetical protein
LFCASVQGEELQSAGQSETLQNFNPTPEAMAPEHRQGLEI